MAGFGLIDLLVTDVLLTDMTGLEFAVLLAPRHASMKVLSTSGYPHNTIMRRGLLAPGVPFLPASPSLQKPFAAIALAGKVREVLDASKG